MRDLDRGRELSRDQCLKLIASSSIGRLVLTENALPTAASLPYAVDGTNIVFRAGAGSKLTTSPGGTVVAFQVDSFDELLGTGWSVAVTGLASLISDPQEELHASKLGIRRWEQPSVFRYIRLTPTIIRGETINASPLGH